jgi:UDP-2-acetamido-3-amino-2,3-dideoxy-glucuronate N-acetyltransferase
MKNIAVIGGGYWGKNLVRNFWELGVLSTICDIDIDKLQDFKNTYQGIKITSSFKEILEDESIKGVAISTPAVSHYSMVKEALLNHKDVFVEKPLSLSVKEGIELVTLAKKQKRVLMVGHILQYHNAVVKLKELIDKGELGKIQYIYSNRLNIGKIRTEENILWSFAPHDISVILMLLNEFPKSVYSTGGNYLQHNVADVTLTTLDFSSGVKSHIFVSWIHPYKEQKLVVVGSKAMAVFDDLSKEKLFLYPHKINWKEGKIPIAEKADCKVIPVEGGEPLKIELAHFVECIRERKNPRTDGEEGLKVLQILELAEMSLKTKIPVSTLNDKKYFIHSTAVVDENVEIGEGSKIWHFSHILSGSKIGKNCIIGQNVVIGPEVKIGDRCKIQNNVSVYKNVELENDVFCGPSCVFTNVLTPRAFVERKHEFKNTLVKAGATIGANTTIVCGNTIGKYAMIAAGAVLVSDAEDYALYIGVPAKKTGWVCKCGVVLVNKEKIKGNIMEKSATGTKISCPNCGSVYILDNDKFYPVEEKI